MENKRIYSVSCLLYPARKVYKCKELKILFSSLVPQKGFTGLVEDNSFEL